MPRMESRGCIEVLDRTLLGMRAVGGCTFCCEFAFPLAFDPGAWPCGFDSSLTLVCLIFFGGQL